MDLGPVDNTVTLRRDMRNPTGGLLLPCSASPRPRAVACPIWRRCQTRSSTPARSSTRAATSPHRDGVGGTQAGRQMGYSRSRIVDADGPPGAALTEGQGISIGTPPGGSNGWRPTRSRWSTPPTCRRCGRCSAATAARRPLDVARTRGRGGLARRRPAHRPPVRHPRNGGARAGGRHRGHRSHAGRVVARDVPGPRQGRPVPNRSRTDGRVDGTVAVRMLMHDEGADDRLTAVGSYLFRAA